MILIPKTWNNGMMEYWNVVFKGIFQFMSIVVFYVKVNFSIITFNHFPKTHYSLAQT